MRFKELLPPLFRQVRSLTKHCPHSEVPAVKTAFGPGDAPRWRAGVFSEHPLFFVRVGNPNAPTLRLRIALPFMDVLSSEDASRLPWQDGLCVSGAKEGDGFGAVRL